MESSPGQSSAGIFEGPLSQWSGHGEWVYQVHVHVYVHVATHTCTCTCTHEPEIQRCILHHGDTQSSE